MTGYERCLAVIQGGVPDRVPAYTPTIASDVAGRILGRTVHTGGPALWYAEAAAWCDGPTAWQEFDCQVTEDIVDLHRALAQDYPDLVIWANLSGDLLRRGTAEEAYRHSMELLEASNGRGYFHGCSNTVLPGTPPENVSVMMKARDDFSRQLAGSWSPIGDR